MPLAGPSIRDSHKAQALQDGPARRKPVHEEVARAEIGRIARPGGNQGPVKAAPSVALERASSVEPRKQAVGVGVQPADADRLLAGISNVAAVLLAAGAQGMGQLVDGEVVVLR